MYVRMFVAIVSRYTDNISPSLQKSCRLFESTYALQSATQMHSAGIQLWQIVIDLS